MPGDLTPTSDLQRYQACTWCTNKHADKTPIHIKFKKAKLFPMECRCFKRKEEKKCMLLLQRFQVWFPAPKLDDSQPPVNSSLWPVLAPAHNHTQTHVRAHNLKSFLQ